MEPEQSPEATVAGEAASLAVDELHSREAVAESAEAAASESVIAASQAEDAVDASQAAVGAAVDATEVAQQASGDAAQAVDASAATLEELRAMRAEFGQVRGFISELVQERQAARETEASNQENGEVVPVNDTAAREASDSGSQTSESQSETSGSGNGETSAAGTTGETSPASRSNGLRRRHR